MVHDSTDASSGSVPPGRSRLLTGGVILALGLIALTVAGILTPTCRTQSICALRDQMAIAAAVLLGAGLLVSPFRRRTLALAVGLGFLVVGMRYAYWEMVERKFEVIAADIVFKSGSLSADVLRSKVDDLAIRTVIDLREEDEKLDGPDEASVLRELGVDYVAMPAEQVPRKETVESFLSMLSQPEVFPVLIHCEHGEGRSVLFSALYRIEFEQWTNEDARRGCRLMPWRGSFKPDSPKGEFLRSYVPKG